MIYSPGFLYDHYKKEAEAAMERYLQTIENDPSQKREYEAQDMYRASNMKYKALIRKLKKRT